MKLNSYILRFVFVAVVGLLPAGCLLKRTTVAPRHFVLAAAPAHEEIPAATEHLSAGIGFVKMPPYLLRDSMAVRSSGNEIEYIEDAVWAERLDQCFQRTLAANLSRLLHSDNIYATESGHNQVMMRVFIDVQQFDVDTQGRGTLIAQWRITAPDNDTLLKRGSTRLNQTGPSPRGNPEAIAKTLSGLTSEFSQELAKSISESAKASL